MATKDETNDSSRKSSKLPTAPRFSSTARRPLAESAAADTKGRLAPPPRVRIVKANVKSKIDSGLRNAPPLRLGLRRTASKEKPTKKASAAFLPTEHHFESAECQTDCTWDELIAQLTEHLTSKLLQTSSADAATDTGHSQRQIGVDEGVESASSESSDTVEDGQPESGQPTFEFTAYDERVGMDDWSIGNCARRVQQVVELQGMQYVVRPVTQADTDAVAALLKGTPWNFGADEFALLLRHEATAHNFVVWHALGGDDQLLGVAVFNVIPERRLHFTQLYFAKPDMPSDLSTVAVATLPAYNCCAFNGPMIVTHFSHFYTTTGDRIVWLFGRVTAAEVAEAAEPDDVRAVVASAGDVDDILNYDASVFELRDRRAFTRDWLALGDDAQGQRAFSVVARRTDGGVCGYGVMRIYADACFVAPLYADCAAVGRVILRRLLQRAAQLDLPVHVRVPNEQRAVAKYLNQCGFKELVLQVRLYSQSDPQLNLAKVCALHTYWPV